MVSEVPDDAQELDGIVKKAEQWRGEHGERRKVAVYDYVWEETEADGNLQPNKEITTHISVHTIYLDGQLSHCVPTSITHFMA